MEKMQEKDSRKKKIIEMVGKIDNQRFLRAIYISLMDFIEETKKEEKPE